MVEVRQEDREAAARYWGNDNPLLELQREFARHRIAARDAALEEAAKVVEKWIEPVMATPHENATYRSIATAIRAMKGPSNG